MKDHRPSLKNTKTKTKGKMKIIRAKHSMSFYPSAVCVKNVSITVNCIECEKSCLLFSTKKLTEKDKIILQGFLDTIFYTCDIPFYNTCDLVMVIPSKQLDDDIENKINHDKEADQEIMDEENDSNEPENSDNKNEKSDNNEEEEFKKKEDSIHEIFSKVFVNDS